MLSKIENTENSDIWVCTWLERMECSAVTKCEKTDQSITTKGKRIYLHGWLNIEIEY